jgi:uncharacterized protein YjgD (DUF1641 family)
MDHDAFVKSFHAIAKDVYKSFETPEYQNAATNMKESFKTLESTRLFLEKMVTKYNAEKRNTSKNNEAKQIHE